MVASYAAGCIVLARTVAAAGLACAAWSAARQAQADGQQRAAEIVTATVRSHPDWDTLDLAFPGGGADEIVSVYDAAVYPVGSTVRLAVDDRGLRQPLSEPYDASPWYALASVLPARGRFLVAIRRAGIGPAPSLPATAVRHPGARRPRPRCVYVYAGQASATDRPKAKFPVRDDIVPAAGEQPEPAVLYGPPAPGE